MVTTPTTGALLVQAAGIVTAVTVLLGSIAWLVYPRYSAWVRRLASDSTFARDQLDPKQEGSTAHKIHHTAELAEQIPKLVARLDRVESQIEPIEALTDLTTDIRLRQVRAEDRLAMHDRRIGNVEEAIITGRKIRHVETLETD